MIKIEELSDVPQQELNEIMESFEADGGDVSVIPQEDGRFTIRAVFLSNDAVAKPGNATIQDPPWFQIARQELKSDVREITGKEDNPRIVEYHQTVSLKAKDDETAWCSSFVNFCMKKAQVNGTNSARARSWENWGKKLDQPVTGCIAVFERPAGGSAAGHVGFFISEENGKIQLLGGNQGNKVSIAPQKISRLLSYRWPDAT